MDIFNKTRVTDYDRLNTSLAALVSDVPHTLANLANAAALLFNTMDDINWAGFYLLKNGKLVLGPFQGKPACIEILVGHGVCGTAVARCDCVVVQNVHHFPGHIACDAASKSEIVLPIYRDGEIFGVLDIDSPVEGRFDDADRCGLEGFVRVLEAAITNELT